MSIGNVVQSVLGMFTTLGQIGQEGEADRAAFAINQQRVMRSIREQERAAQQIEAEGGRLAGLHRTRGTGVQAAQRVGFAAGNVDASTGTAADAQAASAIVSELDAQTARNNALAQALGHRQAARGLGEDLQQMELQLRGRDRERMARFTGSWLGAGTSVLNMAAGFGGGK